MPARQHARASLARRVTSSSPSAAHHRVRTLCRKTVQESSLVPVSPVCCRCLAQCNLPPSAALLWFVGPVNLVLEPWRGMAWGALGCCPLHSLASNAQEERAGVHPAPLRAAGKALCSLQVSSCLQLNITSLSPSPERWLLGKNTLMRQLVKGRNRLAQEPEEL